MSMKMSTSMKRATISFTIPGEGRITVQEDEGVEDMELRAAIKAASQEFFKLWNASAKNKAGAA